MKMAIQQEDTQLLADVLQGQLLTEVPSGNVLQVKCVVQNGQLMTLIQHPQNVVFDTDKIFAVLTKTLQRQFSQHSQQVQCFVRVSGEKLPYAKKILSIEPQAKKEETQQQTEQEIGFRGERDRETPAFGVEAQGLAAGYRMQFPPTDELPQSTSPAPEEVIPPSTPSSGVESPFGSNSTDYGAESSFSASVDSLTESPFGSISLDDSSSAPFGAIDSLGASPFGSTSPDYESNSPFDSATIDALVDSSFNSTSTENSSNISFDSPTTNSGSGFSFGSVSIDSTPEDSPNLSFDSSATDSGSGFSFGSVPLESFPDAGSAAFGSVPLETFPDSGSFLGQENETAEEVFDPFAGAPNLLEQKKQRTSPPVPILIGLAVGVVLIFGGGGFFLVSSCMVGECKELQTAEKLKTDSQTLIRKAKSAKDLEALQSQLQEVVTGLKAIPWWSPRHQQAEELSTSFSEKLNSVERVSKALRQAETVLKKSETPAKNIEELKARQNSWRKAIADFAAIKPNNEFYGLVREKLPTYQLNLQALNEKILTEEKWFNKLTLSKKIADSATQRQAQAKSGNEWQKVQTTWLVVINALKTIPQDSSAYQEAQTLLAEYQPKLIASRDRATKELLAAQSYQTAINAANQAKAYGQKNQWPDAVASWEKAVQNAKQISNDSYYYTQAQPLIETYSANLSQAQAQQQLAGGLAQTRADLAKTCNNGLQFCTFTVDSQRILVRLTPDYERFLGGENSNLGDIQTHFQSLREALGVISQNANLPLVLYDTKGQEIAL
ncbi:MAG TPA: hypothetical protein VK203_28175 [Nostocaceae cyanobacterium]|nr:hypothetical protein [Nostocaceae cyanobacterium]